MLPCILPVVGGRHALQQEQVDLDLSQHAHMKAECLQQGPWYQYKNLQHTCMVQSVMLAALFLQYFLRIQQPEIYRCRQEPQVLLHHSPESLCLQAVWHSRHLLQP